MNDKIIAEFRKKFCVKDKDALSNGYALLLLKANVDNLEAFLTSALKRQKEELREAVGKMKKVLEDNTYYKIARMLDNAERLKIATDNYNEALSAVQSLLTDPTGGEINK